MIKTNGWVVLGRYLQPRTAKPGLAEAVQRLQQQRLAQAAAAPARQDAEVLNRPRTVALAQTLHGAARSKRPQQQPGRLRQKATLARHLHHQTKGTLAIAEAGKDLSVNLLVETAEKHVRMNVRSEEH